MKIGFLLTGLVLSLALVAPAFAENRMEIKQNKFEYRNTGNNVSTRGGWIRTGDATASVELRANIKQKMEEFRSRVWGMVAIVKGTIKSKGDNYLVMIIDGKDVTVNVTDKTKLRRRFWGNADWEEMQVGDLLQVMGKWTAADKTAINALFIRDLSIQKVRAVLVGKIISIDGNVIKLNTVARGDQTVTVDGATEYFNRNEAAIVLADLKTGHRIRVKGVWNRTAKAMIEVSQIKDFDLPVRESSQD
jgi:hypothetical protein